MAPSNQERPFKYSFPQKPTIYPATPAVLPAGKVFIVRGRSASEVYHLWRDCGQLRGVGRIVKETYAHAAGLRPCRLCAKPHQVTLDTTGVPA